MDNPDYNPGTINNDVSVYIDTLHNLDKAYKEYKGSHPSKYKTFRENFRKHKNNMCNIETKPEFTDETKKCACCGKDLPLTHFQKCGTGYRNICNDCIKREAGATDKFKDFSSRELIDELKARGYEGSLTKKIVETIKL